MRKAKLADEKRVAARLEEEKRLEKRREKRLAKRAAKKCPVCGMMFRARSNLEIHRKANH